MNIKKFVINNRQSSYQMTDGNPQNLNFTIEFSDDNHPPTLTIQYDIDESGTGSGVTFSNGSASIQDSVSTPGRLNTAVADSFSLTGGVNSHFGITLTIVQDNSQTENININYTNAHAAAVIRQSHAELEMMGDVKTMVSKTVKSAIDRHVKSMHPKTKKAK